MSLLRSGVQRENMSTDLSNIYNNQMSQYQDRSELSAGLSDRIRQEVGQAPDWTQFGEVQGLDYDPTEIRGRAEDAAYTRATNRLDPRFESERNAMEIRLRNRGLRPGDQAYQAEMESFNMGRNDAYEQAMLGSVGEGRAEADMLWNQQLSGNQLSNALRNQQIQEYIGRRQFSLGEQAALNPQADIANLASTISGEG